MKRYALAILFLITVVTAAIELSAQSSFGLRVTVQRQFVEGDWTVTASELVSMGCTLLGMPIYHADAGRYELGYTCVTAGTVTNSAGEPIPSAPPDTCPQPDPFAYFGGGICFNGGWRMK